MGYPLSRRFVWDGFTVQVFQKVVLQWRPESNTFMFVNVFDRLNLEGYDDTLEELLVPSSEYFEEAGPHLGPDNYLPAGAAVCQPRTARRLLCR